MAAFYNLSHAVAIVETVNSTGVSAYPALSSHQHPTYTYVSQSVESKNFTGDNTDVQNATDVPVNNVLFSCLVYDFILEAVLMGILCIFGFVGNILSMICLWKDKSKTATPTLLISLAVADNLFLLTVFILRVMTSIMQYFRWAAPLFLIPYMGKYIFPCALIAEMGTIYLTLLVTLNRYVSVCLPYEASNLCSIQHARQHVVLVWFFSCLYNIPRFFEFDITTHTDSISNTTFKVHELSDMGNHIVYQIVYSNILYFLVMFLVPLITLSILNSNLINALKRTKRKRKELLTRHKESSGSRSEDDITLILIVVVLVFVVCQTPALITQLLLSFLSMNLRGCPSPFFYYERISDFLVVANSSINFIIYCFCSRRFRHILLNIICKHPSLSKFAKKSPDNSCAPDKNGLISSNPGGIQKNLRVTNNKSETHYTSVPHTPRSTRVNTQF